jgi:CBS domain-containing protein
MRVRELMTEKVTACTQDSTLAGVASRMWLGSCGAVPVLDSARRAVGIITDRDICFAVASQGRLASDIKVREVISGKLYTCSPDDDILDALHTMGSRHVRRLPVVDEAGQLVGILSVTDTILHAERPSKPQLAPDLPFDEVLDTLQSVCRPPVRVADEAELHA